VVLELFKKIATERGQTFLIVTHDEDFASKSDRIIYMEDGQIKEN
jgi:lipoprotein-releasing system ATP-binding protein